MSSKDLGLKKKKKICFSLQKKICDFPLFFFSPQTSAHTDAVEVPSKVSERVNSLQCEEENQT